MKPLIAPIIFIMLLLTISCGNAKINSDNTSVTSPTQPVTGSGDNKPVQMTKALFLTRVSDFAKNPEDWAYKGKLPCVIDFYADWCRPCKMVAPMMETFSQTYQGRVDIYKVNVDQERELAELFGIRSIPTVLFCPMNGKPQMSQGALAKEDYEKIINEFLLKHTAESNTK